MREGSDVLSELLTATGQTLYMVGVSAVLAVLVGLPLGVILVLTDRDGLLAEPGLRRVLAVVVEIGRSLPFLILLVAVIPLTRAVTGTELGSTAAVVPLSVGAVPYFAALAERSLGTVDRGVVDAALAMGARRRRVVGSVLLREGMPGLVSGLAGTVAGLIGYSALVGFATGGGLGEVAVRHGIERFDGWVVASIVVILVVLIRLVQAAGDLLSRRLDHR